MSIAILVGISFIFTATIPFLNKVLKPSLKYSYAALPFGLFVSFLTFLPKVKNHQLVTESIEWMPVFGVNLSFRLDGLSLILALLITGVGTLILIYGASYLSHSKDLNKFYILILLFMSSMLGLVLSDNLIILFLFWELTTITSYLLVGYNHEDYNARKSAQQALLVTGIGGLGLFAGIILIGYVTGSYSLSYIGEHSHLLINNSLLPAIVLLFIFGCFTKSAQFPFHFWLPNAMAAPTPVSAYLHSATMVKAGIYLMFRMSPSFNGIPLWNMSLMIFGGTTMLFASIFGLFYKDLKKVLAYSTLSVLGILTLLIGIGTNLSLTAALLVLIAHALYKATLFMVVGAIDHETGSRDLQKLSGLKKYMPITFSAGLLAALSQAGVPPFLGFISKEYFYKSGLKSEWMYSITAACVISSIILVVLAFKVGCHPFMGTFKKGDLKEHIHDAPVPMLTGPVILAVLGLILGFIPKTVNDCLISPALAQLGRPEYQAVKLWEGINTAFILSVITVLTGVILYSIRKKIWIHTYPFADKYNFRFDKSFGTYINKFVDFAKWQTNLLQSGSLRMYLLIIISGFLVLLTFALHTLGKVPYRISFANVSSFQLTMVLIMIAAAILAAFSRSLITAILAMGVIGFGITVIYLFFGAPDLAITQILVETLSVVMFMAVVYKLPDFKNYSSRRKKSFDLVFSLVVGFFVTLLVLKAQSLKFAEPVSVIMAELSYLKAHGKNIVNVILVDFRALDTFGEATVLAIATMGVSMLLHDGVKHKTGLEESPLLLRLSSKYLSRALLIVALIFLYRGHNQPGGGFIGGLLVAASIILTMLAKGVKGTLEGLILKPKSMILIGLSVIALISLLPLLFGGAFLQSMWLPAVDLPILGSLHLGTPILFDIGVFSVVIGFTLIVIFELETVK